ncbi:pentapeptide repeat-containing protein [Pseudanabaena minima]|uniref:pentapeptide repeat-containing protein n=1 Tax=Pseudanabaena minima TaxID=890415 RepID=UPI003DA98AFB
MASNKNIPQKDQGANQPDKKADAADVDWMIISDISTRIGGSPDIKSGSNQSPTSSSSQVFSNQAADSDLEDLEWLRSLGLDEPIERSIPSRNTSNTSNSQGSTTPNNNEVGDIDWLIVTDLKTRMDDSDNAKPSPSYQDIGQSQTTLQPMPNLPSLDEDLGLDELNFLDNSDFSDLDSLEFDTSNPLSIDDLQSEIDNTEGKIQGLAELLDDNDDSSFDLSSDDNDNDWDSISGILENNFNQSSSELSLDVVSESSEISNQVLEVFGNTEEEFENVDLGSDQFAEIIYSDDLDDLLVSDLDLSEEIQSEDMQFNQIDQIVDDFEIQNDFQSEFQNELQNPQEQDIQDLSFDGFEASNLEAEVNSIVENTLNNDFSDDAFATSQAQEPFDPNVTEDEIWSTNSSNLESSAFDESVENAFTNDWGEASENAIDDAVWDSPSSIDSDLISSTTSIDNAFGISDDWANGSQVDIPETEEYADFEIANTLSETEEYADFDLPNLDSSELEESISFETTNVDSSIETETPFIQDFGQPNNEAEDVNKNENWGLGLNTEDLDANNISDDVSWEASLEDEINIIDAGLSDEANWHENLESEIGIDNEADWSASLEAEISRGNDAWDEELVETEDYLSPSDQPSEIFNDDLLGVVDNNLLEQPLNEDFDFNNSLDENDWAIVDNVNELAESISNPETNNSELPQTYDNFNEISENLDTSDPVPYQQQPSSFNEFDNPSHDDIYSTGSVGSEFNQSENYIPPSSEWDSLSESIAEQITDSDFANYTDSLAVEEFADSGLNDSFAEYADSFDNDFDHNIVPPVNAISANSNWDTSTSQSLVTDNNVDDNLESMLDDNFDLASFDEDSLSGLPVSDLSLGGIPTTLTPSRPISDLPVEEDSLSAGFSLHQSANSSVGSLGDNLVGASDPFEEALVNDLLNDNYAEVNFQEEALAHDLLNGFVSESEDFNDFVSVKDSSPMASPNSNLSSSKFATNTSDHDFLDDFDLDSLDPLTDDGFISAQISTGLTPPTPPIAPVPPSLPPLAKQEPTSPSVNNPPPPPFLPPLPPKRNPTQGSTTPVPPRPNASSQPLPQNRMGRNNEDDFDRFHAQPDQHRQRKPISSIDEGWSELLDADTVLSGGRASTGSSYSDITTSPSAGTSAGKVTQNRDRRERNSSGMPKRKETGLPDFNDLGLEIHDDNTDWSGLLDSGDLSDSITTISPQTTPLPSRVRTTPTASFRSDVTGISETREIPRDRRKPMASFGDSTQARMATPPDQVDFNRFTEDNYDAYGGYDQPVAKPPNPSRTKLTIPSVSLEALWQNYLKLPVIGLGAIGGAFLIYSLLNRPVFDLGLRWGLFKDASGKDFTNADFKGAKLDNVDFSKAILTGAKMQDASLVGANFQEANLDGVNFTNANLSRARLIQSSVIWAEFNKAQMNLVDLAGADLTRSNFVGAKMEGANLKDSKIGAQGTEKATRFSATTLLAWQIVNQPREGRNLASQDLSGLNLSFTSLKRANLSNAKLNYTDLTSTDLSGANLTGSQINGANLSGAKLNGINFTNVNFDKNKLPKTDEETICPNGAKGPCKF